MLVAEVILGQAVEVAEIWGNLRSGEFVGAGFVYRDMVLTPSM